MLYEFIATFSAGFAMAGIALVLRHLTKLILKKQLPKWLIPFFAFIGIMGFQIHQEYHWFEQKKERIAAEGMQVVKTREKSMWYRPWSYIKPQTVGFMAVDVKNMESNQLNPNLKRTTLLIADRLNGKVIPQAFDCSTGKRADFPADSSTETTDLLWIDMDKNDELFKTVCGN